MSSATAVFISKWNPDPTGRVAREPHRYFSKVLARILVDGAKLFPDYDLAAYFAGVPSFGILSSPTFLDDEMWHDFCAARGRLLAHRGRTGPELPPLEEDVDEDEPAYHSAEQRKLFAEVSAILLLIEQRITDIFPPEACRLFEDNPELYPTIASKLRYGKTRYGSTAANLGLSDTDILTDMKQLIPDAADPEDAITQFETHLGELSESAAAPFATPAYKIAAFVAKLHPLDAAAIAENIAAKFPDRTKWTWTQYTAKIRSHLLFIRRDRMTGSGKASAVAGATTCDDTASAAAAVTVPTRVPPKKWQCPGCAADHEPTTCPVFAKAVQLLPAGRKVLKPGKGKDGVHLVQGNPDVLFPLTDGWAKYIRPASNTGAGKQPKPSSS
jgi:hypothetical protein